MNFNFLAMGLAALSTLAVGFVWYHPKVFGSIWMKEAGLTEAQMKDTNMIKMFGLSLIYAFFISFIIQFLTIHQFGAYGMIGGKPELANPSFFAFMADYEHAFRTFKHGALHGFMTGLFMMIPVTATNAMYERRSFKYALVSGGFWTVCFTIMGGILCAME
ncbi:MAG: hypothetical protein CFE24_05830 [Flavobacterium sp. BFFFF2]|nr:MAG: hypothetical protein CFE24_05830 [Flavobacterium sp. BFFFF2]